MEPMTESRTSVLVVATACLGLTGGIFALDLLTPLGIPVWLFYLAPILLWSLTPSRVGPFVQAGLCIALTIIGLFLSPVGAPFTFALINRLFGFPLLGVAAYAVSAPRAEGLASQGARDSLSRRTVASLAGAGFLLVLLATASYWTVVLYQESERFVIHTHEVLTELSRTLSSLTDAETGQRGFLLTGHDGYLEPYTRAVMEIHGHLERLKVLTQDNQLQQSRLQVLDAKVEEKLTELRETVSARQSRGLDEALRIVISDQGKAVMDEIRSLVAVMEGTEQDLLAERAQLSQVMFMALASYLSLGGLLQIGLLAATGLFVRQAQVADQLRIETDATQRRLAAIVESSNDAIIGKTLDGLVTSWNAGAERLFGYSADEMMGQPITVLFPPDRLDEEPRIIERLKRGEHIKHFETVRLRKDGRPVEVLLTHSPVRDRQGTIVGISTIARDITELKQAETAMREALATLDATVDGTFIFDPQTLRFSYVNEGAVRQVGYSREELLCMTPLDIKPEFDEPRFRAMIATLVSGAAEAHNFTTVHRRKDGVDVPVDINLQCVGAGTGGTRLIAIVRDITERRQAEKTFRQVVEGVPNAILLVNQSGIITLVNAQAERLFGYSREELLSRPLETLMPARFQGAHPGHRAAFFANPTTRAMGAGRDLYGQHKDGREIPVEIGLSSIETEGGHMVLASIIDISERKQAAEEIRRQGELLAVANKELEAFSYSVSHDLRAPLRSLDGFSLALLEDCAGQLTEQGKGYLHRIRAASQRMGQLIDDLLGLSRATRLELQREPVDLSALALGSADEVRRIWPGRQVELVVALGLRAEGDRRLLRIVFDNLLGNAWKFTSKQERAAIEVGAISHEGTTAYFVRDNGAGFDMAYADKRSAPFSGCIR
ncbi:MAG: hypothetical protein RL042_1785 [Nitrospirota bacterium]|jgi:PAS domain S-box-containing protein